MHSWVIWSDIHIYQKLVQEGRKWYLQPSCIKHICQLLVQQGRKWHFWTHFAYYFGKGKG